MYRLFCVFFLVFYFSSIPIKYANADAASMLGVDGKVTTLNIVSKIDRLKGKVKVPPKGKRACMNSLIGDEGLRPIKSFFKVSALQMDANGKALAVSKKAKKNFKALCKTKGNRLRKRRLRKKSLKKLDLLRKKAVDGIKNLPLPLVGGEESTIVPVFNGEDKCEIVIVDASGVEVAPLAGTQVKVCGLVGKNAARSAVDCLITKAAKSSRILPAIPEGDFAGGYTVTLEQPGVTINRSFYKLPGQITFKQVPVEPGTFDTAELEKEEATLRRWYTQPVTGEAKAVEVVFPAGTKMKTTDGKDYNGTVDYYIQFIDSLSPNLPPMQARARSGEEGKLISLGMVRVNLRTPEGEAVKASGGENAKIVLPFNSENAKLEGENKDRKDEFGLWTLDTDTGVWSQGGAKISVLADTPSEEPVDVIEEDCDCIVELPPADVTETIHNVDRISTNQDAGCLAIAYMCNTNLKVEGHVEGPEGIQPLPALEIGSRTSYAYLGLIDGTATLYWDNGVNEGTNAYVQPAGGGIQIKRPVPNPLVVTITANKDGKCTTFQPFCQFAPPDDIPTVVVPDPDEPL